ncbi:YHYH domain-containing protein [Brevibacillus ruminantium]|uniref:YHYH domain-containing protein n=2 Tax=Brevibacillus ruminantium TaxID=2950604 RepID=A0ABY4WRF2_9BACL|nr:YHYH domain-containing protein [Brevibacillus ruminantium]USG68470.1 YHYH domain-containing protein [Brevibacillus ruminantium]
MLFSVLPVSWAHPGRTDANGGHTCRTNCEKWGLRYGEYHYHNGGSSTPKSTSTPQTNKQTDPSPQQPAKPAPVIVPIIAVDKATVYIQPVQHEDYVIGQLDYGVIAQDQGSIEGWVTYHFVDGRIGYIPKTVMTTYEAITPKTITIQVEKAYVFSTPSTTGNANGSLAKQATVQALGKNGDWFYISATNAEGQTIKGFVSSTVAW